MSQFMMLLYENPAAFERMSPQEIQSAVKKYVDWRQSMASRGKLVGGNKLRSEPGKILTPAADKIAVHDGPFGEVKELIGGYFLITAKDYDEATALAQDCPHFAFGGVMELREIEPT